MQNELPGVLGMCIFVCVCAYACIVRWHLQLCLDIMRIHQNLWLRQLKQLNQSLMIILITLFRGHRKLVRKEWEERETEGQRSRGETQKEEKRLGGVGTPSLSVLK